VTLRGAATTLALGIAAAGSWYLATSLEDRPEPAQPAEPLGQGYYLRGARILGTDDTGELLYEIEADYAEERGEERIAFDNVRVRYSPQTDVPWSLSADRALITGNRDRLTLSGHVLAVSEAGFADEVTEIRTDRLELEPEAYRAFTDRRVQIRIGERSLTATGMEALLRENRVSLASNVSGKFVP